MNDTAPVFDLHASAHVNASPEQLHAMVSDITRMGEWSPECVGGEWIEGTPAAVGSRFHGHNDFGGTIATTECEVLEAEAGRRFVWGVVTGSPDAHNSVWSFEFEPTERGTTVTQRYVLREIPDGFRARFGDLSPEELDQRIAQRGDMLREALRTTVDNLRAVAEAE